MAFLNRMGSLLKQSAVRHINQELSGSKPSIFQAIRSMSSSKLFIGGISYSTDEMSLREAFARYGEVVDARVIMDRETGRSRGFGFITFATTEDASSAIQAMDGQVSSTSCDLPSGGGNTGLGFDHEFDEQKDRTDGEFQDNNLRENNDESSDIAQNLNNDGWIVVDFAHLQRREDLQCPSQDHTLSQPTKTSAAPLTFNANGGSTYPSHLQQRRGPPLLLPEVNSENNWLSKTAGEANNECLPILTIH
ncbi:hypothetical protein Ahy_A04g017532 isoform B [Arachis hypogaea]|uniref:RRM domain-containing protein n=1 Tax=Arachis hypogaea TaxID=3818 RepID=A0A445DBB5_ARAHY|nr:hypothetical protein Ahy_A04g017532 isoform B [Arachis hypogaea]